MSDDREDWQQYGRDFLEARLASARFLAERSTSPSERSRNAALVRRLKARLDAMPEPGREGDGSNS